jgi:tryptophanyl-tRNA synthetase
MQNPAEIELVLQKGAEKARKESSELLAKLRYAVGIRPLV